MGWLKSKAAPSVGNADATLDEEAARRAAKSVAARMTSIAQAELYVRKVSAGYAGNVVFRSELAKLGIDRDVAAILKKT